MEWFLSIRNFLEIIYFISGPILATGLIIALLQYFQMKKDIISRNDREIANSTISDIHNFIIKIEPLYEEYLRSLNKNLGFNYGKKYISLLDNELYKSSEEYYASISEESINKAKNLAKEMNKFSLSFTFSLSDNTQAKEVIGLNYIQMFDSILFILSIMSVKNKINLNSLSKLYDTWTYETQISETKQEITENKKRLEELEKMAKNKLKPIGK